MTIFYSKKIADMDGRVRPTWLDGVSEPVARYDEGGVCYLGVGIGPENMGLPGVAMHRCEEGWRVGGSCEGLDLVRGADWCSAYLVQDAGRRTWPAPRVLSDQDGSVLLRMAWGRDHESGEWGAVPDEAQQRLIDAARAARDGLVASAHGTHVPMAAAVEWAAIGLSATLHVSPGVLGVLRVIDDLLALRVCMVMAGSREEDSQAADLAEADEADDDAA